MAPRAPQGGREAQAPAEADDTPPGGGALVRLRARVGKCGRGFWFSGELGKAGVRARAGSVQMIKKI